jgi:fused signal recognition particle receptor
MFKSLKDKFKKAVSNFTQKFEEEAEVVEEKVVEEKIELPEGVEVEQPKKEEKKPEPKEGKKEEPKAEKKKEEKRPEPKEEKKGFLSKIKERVTTKKISERQFDELFWDIEVELLESNVAFEVIEKIKEDLKDKLVDSPLKRGEVEEIILSSLRESIDDLLNYEMIDIVEEAKTCQDKPYIVAFIGTNGSGKTTTIAKMTKKLQNKNLSVVLAAADTFRAGALQQLEEHGEKLGAKVIKHGYESDPAAVAFDAIKYAKMKHVDVVLIDTSGRLHNNVNLMKELEKIIRVAKPHLKILVTESIIGNDAVDQAKNFNKAVDIDGIILSKADIDEKGGAIISMSYVLKKPVIYLGTGQDYQDLKKPNKEEIKKSLGL